MPAIPPIRETGVMERTPITPGRLYARLAAEYRRMRPEHCGSCRMPMVALVHRPSPEASNWTVEELGPLCEKCRVIVGAIVKEAAEEYDLRDPVSVPYFPLPGAAQASGGAHARR